MDKEVYKKLEGLKEDFNQDIKRTFEFGKPKIKLENDIDNLIREYMSKVESYFSIIEHGVNVRNYFEDRFAELKRSLENTTTDITVDVSTFLTRLNDREFDRNIEILDNSKANNEMKKDELTGNARRKQTELEDEKSSLVSDSYRKAEVIKQEADKILEKTCAHAKRLVMTSSSR